MLVMLPCVRIAIRGFFTQTSVVAYGDSLTADASSDRSEEWCGLRTWPELDCVPRGVGGEKTAEGVARLIADLDGGAIPTDTEFVVLAWGANDLRKGGWNAEQLIFEPLEQAAEALDDAGLKIVFWVPNPQFLTPGTQDELHEVVNLRIETIVRPGIESIAQEYQAPVLDLYALFEPQSTDFSVVYDDHVHPSRVGNDWIADLAVARLPEPDVFSSSTVALLVIGLLVALQSRRHDGG